MGAALAVGACGTPAQARPAPAATATAAAAPTDAPACGAAARMPDLGHDHITSLTYSYPQHPATSGPHYPVWLMPPPQVFSTPVPEVRAVHNLEHGYVVVYYSAAGATPAAAATVSALATRVAGQRKVLMAPYAQLPPGSALAFAAWDELQLCGAGVGADEATAALGRFVAAFREGPLAPEAQAS